MNTQRFFLKILKIFLKQLKNEYLMNINICIIEKAYYFFSIKDISLNGSVKITQRHKTLPCYKQQSHRYDKW